MNKLLFKSGNISIVKMGQRDYVIEHDKEESVYGIHPKGESIKDCCKAIANLSRPELLEPEESEIMDLIVRDEYGPIEKDDWSESSRNELSSLAVRLHKEVAAVERFKREKQGAVDNVEAMKISALDLITNNHTDRDVEELKELVNDERMAIALCRWAVEALGINTELESRFPLPGYNLGIATAVFEMEYESNDGRGTRRESSASKYPIKYPKTATERTSVQSVGTIARYGMLEAPEPIKPLFERRKEGSLIYKAVDAVSNVLNFKLNASKPDVMSSIITMLKDKDSGYRGYGIKFCHLDFKEFQNPQEFADWIQTADKKVVNKTVVAVWGSDQYGALVESWLLKRPKPAQFMELGCANKFEEELHNHEPLPLSVSYKMKHTFWAQALGK